MPSYQRPETATSPCNFMQLVIRLMRMATKGTLEAVCADLVDTPDPHTIRGYFNEQLCVEELPALEQRLNAAVAAEVPRRVRRDRKSTRLNSSHIQKSRMPSSA